MRDTLKAIDQYWFGHGSPVSLGVMRILFGFLAFLNLLMLSGQFTDWFTEAGFVPQNLAHTYMADVPARFDLFGQIIEFPFSIPRLNLIGGVTDSTVTALFFVFAGIVSITTAIGFWTRFSTIALALCTVSIQHRNGLVLHGGDTVLRIMLMYLALAPCGKACSLDRVIALWKGKATEDLEFVSLWPQRLITFNVALIYVTTVWHKWGGTVWREGLGTWFPARLNEFKRFPVPPFFNEIPFVYITSYGTLITELALGTLVFYRPWRKWVLAAGLLMHGYIEYSMNIPLFSFLMCSTYIAFYEGEEVSSWAKRLARQFSRYKITMFSPRGKVVQPGAALALAAMDPLELVYFEDGAGNTWEARSIEDKPQNPVRASRRRTAGAWWFSWIPGIWPKLLDRALEEEVEIAPQPREIPKVVARKR